MISCIAVDDEANALKVIELYAQKVEKLNLQATFTNPVRAAEYLARHTVDLLFLDINMKSLNGFELLESLPHPPLVIFTTAYSEYAVKSYTVDALDYLVKPFTFIRFLKAIHKADAYASKEPKAATDQPAPTDQIISVKSGTTIHRINIRDILYLEAEGNYTKFVTVRDAIMVLCTMKEALAKVDAGFIQTHRSYAVAMAKVNTVDHHQLRVDDKVIPIGATFRGKVLELFAKG